jgi:hypothetical protein
MKTRRLLVLLLTLPLLVYCGKNDPVDNTEEGTEQDPGQGQGTVDPPAEDPFADAAQEVKNGDRILVTN